MPEYTVDLISHANAGGPNTDNENTAFKIPSPADYDPSLNNTRIVFPDNTGIPRQSRWDYKSHPEKTIKEVEDANGNEVELADFKTAGLPLSKVYIDGASEPTEMYVAIAFDTGGNQPWGGQGDNNWRGANEIKMQSIWGYDPVAKTWQSLGVTMSSKNGNVSFADAVANAGPLDKSRNNPDTSPTPSQLTSEPPAPTFPCFTRGTLIETDRGLVAVEALEAGDMVKTEDHGMQAIRWIGSNTVPAMGVNTPVLFKEGAIGNARDLRVSPQHRMVIGGLRSEILFGEEEVLATAKSLVNDSTIVYDRSEATVEYFHILFDRHEVIFAEGAATESFHPGEQGMKAFDLAVREEIIRLFPQLEQEGFAAYGPSARMSLKPHEAKLLSN